MQQQKQCETNDKITQDINPEDDQMDKPFPHNSKNVLQLYVDLLLLDG